MSSSSCTSPCLIEHHLASWPFSTPSTLPLCLLSGRQLHLCPTHIVPLYWVRRRDTYMYISNTSPCISTMPSNSDSRRIPTPEIVNLPFYLRYPRNRRAVPDPRDHSRNRRKTSRYRRKTCATTARCHPRNQRESCVKPERNILAMPAGFKSSAPHWFL